MLRSVVFTRAKKFCFLHWWPGAVGKPIKAGFRVGDVQTAALLTSIIRPPRRHPKSDNTGTSVLGGLRGALTQDGVYIGQARSDDVKIDSHVYGSHGMST